MPTPTPAFRVGPFITITGCGTAKRLSANSKARNQKVLFVCVSSRNRDHFLPYFTKVFNLRIDDDTVRGRLQARAVDDWEVGPDETELVLAVVGHAPCSQAKLATSSKR